ncbi:hypothetical protein B7Y94_00640 [Candidatus Saccharibacteria bacterium 32-49-12]|nr:MAG: hypothetical protein B7Y94_00640 [Candidatus Saccharibacteria bacterium 32-49-12]
MVGFLIGLLINLVVASSAFSLVTEQPESVIESAPPRAVMTHVQAGPTGMATEELIVLHNNSHEPLNITGWCFRNKNLIDIACFDNSSDFEYWLPPFGDAIVASESFASRYPDADLALIFSPISQSSGSLVGSSDNLQLVDDSGQVIDSYQWFVNWSSRGVAYREACVETDAGCYYDQSGLMGEWSFALDVVWPINQVEPRPTVDCIDEIECSIDEDIPIESEPESTPVDLIISELLPNALGSDAGQEFIEIYNRSEQIASLEGYSLEIVGTTIKRHMLPEDMNILANDWLVIGNSVLSFSLPNTSASVRLIDGDGNIVATTEGYHDPSDGFAWQVNELGEWSYSSQPSPGQANVFKLLTLSNLVIETDPAPKPCLDGQYRHPETNRCRKIISVINATPAACKDGYYRSPETGRCRKIPVVDAPKDCPAGQARNPETGRCRKVAVMSKADSRPGQTAIVHQPNQWYVIVAVVGTALALIGYGAWEFRSSLAKISGRLWNRVSRPRS